MHGYIAINKATMWLIAMRWHLHCFSKVHNCILEFLQVKQYGPFENQCLYISWTKETCFLSKVSSLRVLLCSIQKISHSNPCFWAIFWYSNARWYKFFQFFMLPFLCKKSSQDIQSSLHMRIQSMGLQTELYILNKSTSVDKTQFSPFQLIFSYHIPTSQLKQFLLASTVLGKVYNLVEKLLDFNKIIPATSGDSKAHRLSY